MDTKLIHIKENSTEFTAEEDAGLRQAGEIIKNGGLVAFPTETVYGLGGDALNPASSRKITPPRADPPTTL